MTENLMLDKVLHCIHNWVSLHNAEPIVMAMHPATYIKLLDDLSSVIRYHVNSDSRIMTFHGIKIIRSFDIEIDAIEIYGNC